LISLDSSAAATWLSWKIMLIQVATKCIWNKLPRSIFTAFKTSSKCELFI
jgi:hypothetical protein